MGTWKLVIWMIILCHWLQDAYQDSYDALRELWQPIYLTRFIRM